MSKELIELKNIADDFFAKADAFVKTLKETDFGAGANVPSDENLLDDGWIRHTGDVCPVHELDEVVLIFADGSTTGEFAEEAVSWNWGASDLRITHYKVTKAYDPHAENKALYAKDALEHEEPWKLWEYESRCRGTWKMLSLEPSWLPNYKYRRKQTKKLVDWSCPLLKGASTNYGEIFDIRELIRYGKVICSQGSPATNLLRLVPPADDKSNWQAYNGEDLNLLHDAGFVVEVKCSHRDAATFFTTSYVANADQQAGIASYRVIAIRDGFKANPAEVV